jgi:FkbM family methyltransferase
LAIIQNLPPQSVVSRAPALVANRLQLPWRSKISLPNGLDFWLPSDQVRPAAKYLIREIFSRRRYFRENFQIRPGDTVLDIGANMGLFTLWAAPQACEGRVVAVEPSRVIDCLSYNIRANRLRNVTAVPVAVGSDGSQLELIEYPGFNLVSHPSGMGPALLTRWLILLRYFHVQTPTVRRSAPCQSLGTLMDEYGLRTVNFLKVDCEGAEYEMFRTLAPEHWKRIERVAMEFHELRPGDRHGELVSLFQSQGFRVAIRKPLFEYYFLRFGELWTWRET